MGSCLVRQLRMLIDQRNSAGPVVLMLRPRLSTNKCVIKYIRPHAVLQYVPIVTQSKCGGPETRGKHWKRSRFAGMNSSLFRDEPTTCTACRAFAQQSCMNPSQLLLQNVQSRKLINLERAHQRLQSPKALAHKHESAAKGRHTLTSSRHKRRTTINFATSSLCVHITRRHRES